MVRRVAPLLVAGLLSLGVFGGPAAQQARAASLQLCGPVTAHVAPTPLIPGLLAIGAVPLTVAAGATLPAGVDVGDNLCFDLTTDASGSVTGGTVSANATSTVSVCGEVTSAVAASPTTTGSLGIDGRTFTMATGSSLPAGATVGSDICADLVLNAFGQVQGGSTQANVRSTVRLCGVVTSVDEATATSTGRLTVDGRIFPIAPGASLPASVRAGADLCMALVLNALGQVEGGSAVVNTSSTVQVCGTVDSVAQASATRDGSLDIGPAQFGVAAGTVLDSAIRAGANVRLRMTLDAFGRIVDADVLDVGASFAETCSAQPAVPAAPAPTPTPDSAAPAAPSASSTTQPAASPAASASANPSGPTAPPSSNGPTSSPAPAGPDARRSGQAGFAGSNPPGSSALGAGAMPDTDSLLRTAGVVGANAVPMVLVGGIAAAAAWFAARRRRPGPPVDP